KKLSGAKPTLSVLGFDNLQQTLAWFFSSSNTADTSEQVAALGSPPLPRGPTFDDMRLLPEQQLLAKVIATGGHSALLQGPPGTGKSMFAERLPSLLPPMEPRQHVEAMTIQSAVMERLSDAML